MNPAWGYAVVAAAGAILAAVWPLTPALTSREAIRARITCAIIAVVACAAIGLAKGVRSVVWMTAALVAAAAAVLMLFLHIDANGTCVAEDYPGGPTIIGRDYTNDAAEYIRKTGTVSLRDLLLDVGGDAGRLWTPESIARCRFWVGWGGLLAVPLFAACVAALIARRPFRFIPPTVAGVPPRGGVSPGSPRGLVYDAFLSYRHAEPDKTHATRLLEELESRGLRVAIDVRDFRPNEHFLTEMERCIKESRFVLCVITALYVESDHTSEEAIISKTLDMADRQKRIVPLKFEQITLPVWLHGLVGIDFTQPSGVDPLERLVALLTSKPGDAHT